MTTLQVLLAASRAAAEGMGAGSTAARFTGLLENRSETINAQHPLDRYKVWPVRQERWCAGAVSMPTVVHPVR